MHTKGFPDEEFIPMPIPKRFVGDVIKFLAEKMKSAEQGPELEQAQGAAGGATGVPARIIDWTQIENMQKLRGGLTTLPIGVVLMDKASAAALADPDQRVSFEEVYQAAGFTESARARSTLGTFTRILKRDFGLTAKQAPLEWPVERPYGDNGEAFYRMSPDVAQAWIQSAP